MLDIKFIRENPEKVKEGCQKKGIKVDIERLLKVDKKRRELIQEIESLKARQNKISQEIGLQKEPKEEIKKQAQEIKIKIKEIEPELENLEKEFKKLMNQIPNLPLEEVPFGQGEEDNVILKEVGEKPKFDFSIQDYLSLAEKLDLIDVKRASKIAGSRFGYLKKEAVLLEFALVQFAFDTLTQEGFTPMIPPVMIKPEIMKGMSYIEREPDEAYYLEKDKLYLVGTSEQSIVPYFSQEILEEKNLPIRFVGFSTCFRREAGSYGKDTKGILRVHQFDKIEMISFSHPDKSKEEHKYLLNLEEKLMQSLKIPYRVIQICTGDLSFPSAATYDLEAWLPGQNQYRETHSCSNCTDFQARRLNIRFRSEKTKKLEFVHILNGTAFAIGRTIIAILENYQQKNGRVKIPEVLQKYLGKETI